MPSSPPPPPRTLGIRIRWWLLILILVAAVLAVVARTNRGEIEIGVAVTFTNLSDDLLIAAPSRQVARVLVTGSSLALERLDLTSVSCHLDLSGLPAGSHTLPVHPADLRLPKGVALKALLTPSVMIRLEAASTKTVGVVAVLEGHPASGYAVAAVSLQPDRVVLKGTANLLADIETVKTHPINLEDAAESFKKEVPLHLPETIAVTPPLRIVVAQVQVSERIITRVLENISVTAQGSEPAHSIQPESIVLTVSGPESIVNGIESDPAFSVTVDVEGLSPGDHMRKAAINLPVGTTLIDATPEHFRVTVRKQG